MNGRHPGRLLAPVALAACAIALLLVFATGGGEDDPEPAVSTPAPTATATATATETPEPESEATTYTVQPGDTPSSIADAEGIDVDELLEANPDIDPAGLSVGQELTLP